MTNAIPRWTLAAFAAATFLLGHTHARAENGYTRCAIGDRVADMQGHTGTVVSITDRASGNHDGTFCYVDIDGGEKHHYYIGWMLHRAGTARVSGTIAAGTYKCYSGPPLRYTFMDLIITGPGSYRDNRGHSGTYSYSATDQRISFRSGPFVSAGAKNLGDGSIGMASSPGSTFMGTTCSLER